MHVGKGVLWVSAVLLTFVYVGSVTAMQLGHGNWTVHAALPGLDLWTVNVHTHVHMHMGMQTCRHTIA